jgi:hypothetical protein
MVIGTDRGAEKPGFFNGNGKNENQHLKLFLKYPPTLNILQRSANAVLNSLTLKLRSV